MASVGVSVAATVPTEGATKASAALVTDAAVATSTGAESKTTSSSTPSSTTTSASASSASSASAASSGSATTESKAAERAHKLTAERIKEMDDFPIIDLSHFLTTTAVSLTPAATASASTGESAAVTASVSASASAAATPTETAVADDCKTIARLLHHYGFLIVRDPRVTMEDNDTFIDMMERYYGQPEEKKSGDVRKEIFYQVGITPTRTERARNHCEKVGRMDPAERPMTECPPDLDNKLRFFWRIGPRPEHTDFKQMAADPVIPAAFPEWTKVMDTWGNLIMATVGTVAEMAAIGFRLPRDTFTNLMKCGPHLLAPTGSDFNRFGSLGTVLANYHYDLNFLTIHGRSRFPSLFIWTRDGKKLLVKVPPKCLLLQAGKQFEWLTGGHVLAGFHEVVVVSETMAAIEKARAAGKSLWRVSSTLFSHINSDQTLQPLGHFHSADTLEKYPPTKAGHQVQAELDAIKLGRDEMGMGVVAAQ
jgi:isopenicillin N synthase-like dioxygenase